MQPVRIRASIHEKGLGILISSSLKTKSHTDRGFASPWGMLGSIRRSFGRLSLETFKILYASHVRPRLEYSRLASFPCTDWELLGLETVQQAAAHMLVGLRGSSYDRRLQSYRWTGVSSMGIRFSTRRPNSPSGTTALCEDTYADEPEVSGPLVHRLSRRGTAVRNELPTEVMEENSDLIQAYI